MWGSFPSLYQARFSYADITQAFLSSHRDSLETHLTLLAQTQCRTIIVAKQAPAVAIKILEERPILEFSIPGFEYFDKDQDIEIYSRQGAFTEVRDRPFVILHTSGTTDFPKPVYVTYGAFASNDAHHMIPSLGEKPTFRDYIRGRRYFLALPMIHSANLMFTMGFNLFFGVTCVLPPPVPMTVDVVNKMHTFISGHPAVKSAIIGGHGQFQAALLVEPKQLLLDDKERLEFILDIWPTVTQADRDCPAHGRIMKESIMVKSPDKPLPRTSKDTVQSYITM